MTQGGFWELNWVLCRRTTALDFCGNSPASTRKQQKLFPLGPPERTAFNTLVFHPFPSGFHSKVSSYLTTEEENALSRGKSRNSPVKSVYPLNKEPSPAKLILVGQLFTALISGVW